MSEKTKSSVRYLTINLESEDQRIDNFLFRELKNVPKSHVYRLIRKGEVRVNKKRILPSYKLKNKDQIRVPPVVVTHQAAKTVAPSKETYTFLLDRILFEDENILILNKPSGMSVHGGKTVRLGIIEALRYIYPQFPHLELAHRLDAETSGCLILAKKKKILREVHSLLRANQIKKTYWAFTKGKWKTSELAVNLPLQKHYRNSGKHLVEVHQAGKPSLTKFHPLKVFEEGTLVEVELQTGRTHQIRVHAQVRLHPIAGDDRYGDPKFNKKLRTKGLKRLFLHARSVDFILPSLKQRIRVVAPLDSALELFINKLNTRNE